MKILLVYAHPSESSFNAALKQCAITTLLAQHHDIQVSDLYQQHFKVAADWSDFTVSPEKLPPQYGAAQKTAYEKGLLQSDILAEQEKIIWSDFIILQFPLWWFGMPAILKGWFDRVFTPGFAYDKARWFNTAPLFGRQAKLVFTTQAPESSYTKDGLNGEIQQVLAPIHHSLHFLGITPQSPFIAYGAAGDDPKLRNQYIEQYAHDLQNLKNVALIPMPNISDYDEALRLKKTSI